MEYGHASAIEQTVRFSRRDSRSPIRCQITFKHEKILSETFMLLSKRRGTGRDSVKLRRHAALRTAHSTRTAPVSRSGTDDEPVG
jgi:hypothetical protein